MADGGVAVVAGMMAIGRVSMGLHHSFPMVLIAFVAFAFFM